MKIINNIFAITSLLAIVTTTRAQTNENGNASLRGGTSSYEVEQDQPWHRQLGKSNFKVITSSSSGSKIAWRIFEKDDTPTVQDQYENTVKFVHVQSYYSGSTSVSLYDGVEYCLRVYKGQDTSEYGSATGSNNIQVTTGSFWSPKTLTSISINKPTQYTKCFKPPGRACPYPGGSEGEKIAGVAAIGPFDSLTAKEVADEANKVSRESGLTGEEDGEWNAFRHCYASCRLTQEIGSGQAEKAGDIHENCFDHGFTARKKDQYNNKKGREFGNNAKDKPACYTSCFNAVKARTLFV